jgi:murein L,D-transpeptidase YcbB/YkuD
MLGLYFFSLSASTDNTDTNTSRALIKLLNSNQHPLLQQTDFSHQTNDLTKLYRFYAMQPIWLGKDRSEKNLNDALTILMNANTEGLNPVNYDAEQLHHYLQSVQVQSEIDAQTIAAYDLAVSISLLRFAHDLHSGRVDPRSFNYPLAFSTKSTLNTPALIKSAIDQNSIDTLPQALAPKIKQYSLLKQALALYRQQSDTKPHINIEFHNSLHPGDRDPQLPEMRSRLLEMGQLSAEELIAIDASETLYDDVTKTAVMRLQKQQGLNADGFIGKQTLALLNQTAKEKIALIELAMERLRWLPKQPEGRQIIVNIPAFQLWAFNSVEDDNPLTMKVVVGKAKENQTPVLWEEMKYLEFMPYWNIPRSIMDKEIVPKIQTNNDYLNSQDIELVENKVADDEEYDAEELDVAHHLKHGYIRARQRPGKKNPLGKVKFIFPNQADVYLHDTPGRGAFSRDRRDLSHGCVRVAEAEKLAEFVLENQSGWDKQTIQQAMIGPKTKRVSLKNTIPVLFFYTTAFAGQDNKLRFYPDIYGYDQQLQSALNKSANQPLLSKTSATDG